MPPQLDLRLEVKPVAVPASFPPRRNNDQFQRPILETVSLRFGMISQMAAVDLSPSGRRRPLRGLRSYNGPCRWAKL